MSIMDGASATGWVRHGHWTDEQWVLIGRYSIRSIWYLLLICISLTRYFLLTCFWYIMVRKQQLPFFRKERDWVGSTAKSAIAKHLASYLSLTKCTHIAASISLTSKPSVTQSVKKICIELLGHQKRNGIKISWKLRERKQSFSFLRSSGSVWDWYPGFNKHCTLYFSSLPYFWFCNFVSPIR